MVSPVGIEPTTKPQEGLVISILLRGHAFILASSTDPKEFIQRRGRVLRLYSHKEYAYIHDFVTIPNADENIRKNNLTKSLIQTLYQ